MRTLDELGISTAPWTVVRVTRQKEAVIKASDNAIVATMHADNASLIAAAPELYRALREAVIRSCDECAETNIEGCRGKCYVAAWREVLAKAAGEEAK